MTAPQGAPGSGDTAVNPTPARPWLIIDTTGEYEFPTAKAALDHWMKNPTALIAIIPPAVFAELDMLPTLELPRRRRR